MSDFNAVEAKRLATLFGLNEDLPNNLKDLVFRSIAKYKLYTDYDREEAIEKVEKIIRKRFMDYITFSVFHDHMTKCGILIGERNTPSEFISLIKLLASGDHNLLLIDILGLSSEEKEICRVNPEILDEALKTNWGYTSVRNLKKNKQKSSV